MVKATLTQAFEAEMAAARNLYPTGCLEAAFGQLERAHVIGQRYVLPHVRSCWWMLKIGLAQHSPAEVWGQATRIMLGSAVNIILVWNIGGTDISMFKRLPTSVDIAKILDDKTGG